MTFFQNRGFMEEGLEYICLEYLWSVWPWARTPKPISSIRIVWYPDIWHFPFHMGKLNICKVNFPIFLNKLIVYIDALQSVLLVIQKTKSCLQKNLNIICFPDQRIIEEWFLSFALLQLSTASHKQTKCSFTLCLPLFSILKIWSPLIHPACWSF